MDAWPDNKGYCGAATGQWCVEASVFGSFGQRNGPTVAIDPDDHVTIDYLLGTDGNTWTQTVSSLKLGKVVSTLQSTSGQMPKGGFGFATEADANSYTIDTQYYLCTELDLAAADPHFGATGVGGIGAQYGATGTGSGIGTAKNLRTPDGGLTWLVDLITLPAMQPQGTQTPAPAINCSTTSGADAGTGHSSSSSSSSSSSGSSSSSSSGSSSGSGSSGSSSSTTTSSSGSGSSGLNGTSSGSDSSGSAASTSGGASGSSGASTGGASSGESSGGVSSEGSSGATGSGSSGTASGGTGSGHAGDASVNSEANPSETNGCSCTLVGADTEASTGLTVLALGLTSTFMRRRRTTRKG
jgi:hypothetical protein